MRQSLQGLSRASTALEKHAAIRCRHLHYGSAERMQASTTWSRPERIAPAGPADEPGLRIYRYVVDVHGQLFLHDTVPKNLTSCFKNTQFLDFFYARLRPNPASRTHSDPHRIAKFDIYSESTSEWPDDPRLLATSDDLEPLRQVAYKLADEDGYEWISPCGPELNCIKAQDTPVVYRQLSTDGKLKYAGEMEETFQPDRLVVDPDTGYVYHPSPSRKRPRRDAASDADQAKKYGRYSLLSSNLVLEHLAEGLDIDPSRFEHGDGGSIEWHGRRHALGLLNKSSSCPADSRPVG